MEFEDVLKEVGDWGRFQKFLIAFYGLSVATVSVFSGMAIMFMLMVPDHRCNTDEAVYSLRNETISLLLKSTKNMSCAMIRNGSLEESSCITGWNYDKTDFEATASTKWNLVCDYSHYPSIILTLQNVGSLLGTTIYGALADRYGRKLVCFGMLILSAVTDLASISVNSLLAFCILRTINGSVLPNMYILPYVLISEFVPPKKRVLVNVVFNTGWTLGMCILPLVAYLSRSWIILAMFSAFSCASVLLFWKFVPESASWLVSREKYNSATRVMMLIAERNNEAPEKSSLMMKLKELGKRNKEEGNDNKSGLSFITRYPRLRRHFFILTFGWMANQLGYMGLQYNVINLSGNVFLNFFLLSVVEAPGNFLYWYLMEKLGRRWSASFGLLSVSVCCLLPLTGVEYSDVACSIIGKLITAGLFMNLDQQGCELFPTVVRSSAVSAAKALSMSVVLFTPFIAYLGSYGRTIPFLIIGSTTLIAAFSSTFLPETLNENLPQTFLDAENFGINHKYFSIKRKLELIPVAQYDESLTVPKIMTDPNLKENSA